ncbi:MAG: hypothetical protein PHQ62_03540 [Clostridia bacterium]|nr:hypothetical protein [Clostridia bacterium]
MINENALKTALERLEQKNNNALGYNVKEILNMLNINSNEKTEKQTRGKLRSMISKKLYPEFKTAGNEDIVYCPNDKYSGKYRLSKYKKNN